MSYIDALYKKDEDKIYVVERDPKKGRVFVEYDARYVFYYQDARGKHRSMWSLMVWGAVSKVTPEMAFKYNIKRDYYKYLTQ